MRNFINLVENLSDQAVEKTAERIGPVMVKLLAVAGRNPINADIMKEIEAQPGESIDRQFIRYVATQIDPTPKSIYTVWLIKAWLGGAFRYLEDMSAARPLLALYDKAKPKLDVAQREINSFKAYAEFEAFVETLKSRDVRSNKAKDRDTEAELIASGQAVIYLDTPDIKIIIPRTEAASCWFGRNTKWCTAATGGRNAFTSYAKRGDLYIILFKRSNTRWQIQPATSSFMDEADKPLSEEQIKSVAKYLSDDVWEKAIRENPGVARYVPNLTPAMLKIAEDAYGSVMLYSDGKMTVRRDMTDSFADGFIEVLLYDAGSNAQDTEDEDALDENGGTDYFYPENIEDGSFLAIVRDCVQFQRQNAKALDKAYAKSGYEESSAGYDFYQTRVGAGVGFWDRSLGSVGETLTEEARQYGNVYVYYERGVISVSL